MTGYDPYDAALDPGSGVPLVDDVCSCPDVRRMGRSDGVVHPHGRSCDRCKGMPDVYVWVVDGVHLCGRCRWGVPA